MGSFGQNNRKILSYNGFCDIHQVGVTIVQVRSSFDSITLDMLEAQANLTKSSLH